MAKTKKKKGPSLSVRGKITITTHISESDSNIISGENFINEAIHYLVQEKGTAEAKKVIREKLKGYENDYQGYFSNYDENGNIKES